jgi:hypothetical protein
MLAAKPTTARRRELKPLIQLDSDTLRQRFHNRTVFGRRCEPGSSKGNKHWKILPAAVHELLSELPGTEAALELKALRALRSS